MYVRAKDMDNNPSSITSYDFVVDNTKPIITAFDVNIDAGVNSPVFVFSGSDGS